MVYKNLIKAGYSTNSTMMYILFLRLILCLLSMAVICSSAPSIEVIRTSSSTVCQNSIIPLDGNFQSITFNITGNDPNYKKDKFAGPSLLYANDTLVCKLIDITDNCSSNQFSFYTCTCEEISSTEHHFTFRSTTNSTLQGFTFYVKWFEYFGNNFITSENYTMKEVRDEECPCKVNEKCIAFNWTGLGKALCVLAVFYYFRKKYQHKTARIVIFVVGLVVCSAVFIGFVLCLTVTKCLTTSERVSAGVGISIVCVVFFNFFILQFCKCHKTKDISDGSEKSNPARDHLEEMDTKSDQSKQSNNFCRKDDTKNYVEIGGTKDNNKGKTQISPTIQFNQESENSVAVGGTGTRTKENGKKKKASKKKETGNESKGETSSLKPVKEASMKEGSVRRKGTEDNVKIPLTPLDLKSENQVFNSQGAAGNEGTSGISDTSSTTSPESVSQVSNDQGAAKSAGTDIVRNEKASGDKNSDRPSTTPPESQGKMEGKKALKNEANENRRNSVPTKPSENQGTNEPENTKKLAWGEPTETVQKASEKKQTGNKEIKHKNKAQSSSSGSKSRPPP